MFRRPSSLVLLAVLGACAPAAPPASPAAAPSPVRELLGPDLPLSAFIDSAALHQALLAAPPAPAEFRLKPLYVVVYDSTGALKDVKMMSERQFPAEYGRRMVELLRANVRPRIAATKPSVNHVWLQSGSSPRIEVQLALVEARPKLSNTATISRAMTTVAERLQQANPGLAGSQLTVEVSMLVSDEGVPEEPKILRSSGNFAVDRDLVTLARSMRFTPATVDGYAVKVHVRVPVTIIIPQPRQPSTNGPRR